MSNGSSDREKRLAEALRTNLRRRKGLARAQKDEARGVDELNTDKTPASGDSEVPD